MRMLTPLIVLMFSALALLIGCDRELKQPILEIVSPPQDSLKKARAAMKRVSERRAEVHRKAEGTNDFSTIFTASEDIFKEELGFRKELWVDLVDIYRQENLENTELFEGLENLQNAFAKKLAEGTHWKNITFSTSVSLMK